LLEAQVRQVIYTLLFTGVFISSFSIHQYMEFPSEYGGFAEAELIGIVEGGVMTTDSGGWRPCFFG
jgi:hypothetical protein